MDCQRLTPCWFRRMMADAIAARSNASINRFLRRGEGGGAEGRGRERGTLLEAEVVVTVTVTLVVELPVVAESGVTVQMASEGAPVQEKLTVPDIPPSPPMLKA